MKQILENVQRAIGNLTKRIEDLEAANNYLVSTDWMRSNWWGLCSPTFPASRIVYIHGGYFWSWTTGGAGYYRKLDDTSYDMSGVSAFTATSYYRWAIVQADVTSGNTAQITFTEGGTDFGTWEECERDFWDNAPSSDFYSSHIPLCALVLRNNGYLAINGAVENITLSDREQSYFLIRDMRPWLHVHI